MLHVLSHAPRATLLLSAGAAVVAAGAAGVAAGAAGVGLLVLRASLRRRLTQWPDSSGAVLQQLISLTSWQPPWPPLTEVFTTRWLDE